MEQQLFKLKVKFGGYFKKIKSSTGMKYYFERQKSWLVDVDCYCYKDLYDDIVHTFNLKLEETIKIWPVIRDLTPKSYMILDTDQKLMSLFEEYKDLKECFLFVTKEANIIQLSQSTLDSQDQIETCRSTATAIEEIRVDEVRENQRHNDSEHLATIGIDILATAIENNDYIGVNDETLFQEEQETDTEIYSSESSYHSIYNSDSDDDDENIIDHGGETYEMDIENPTMAVGAKYTSREQFKVALSQYAILNEFAVRILKSEPGRMTVSCKDEACNWRLHASLLCDGHTFQVKKLKEPHTCSSINKCGNKMATQFWICDKIIGWLRKEGNLSPIELRRKLLQFHHLELPYHRVWRGKELAMSMIHGNWADSFERMEDFKEELLRRNPDSVVKLKLDMVGDKHYFHHFFICLRACSTGFLAGCRPFIGLDGRHLKGKYRGVMMAATSLDGNNGLFSVAFGVAESENSDSWTWFLEALKESIQTPEGLVLVSDRQKGLEKAVQHIYPQAEHRKFMRHLYKNFQTKFSGYWLKIKLWGAARAYTKVQHDDIINQIKEASLEAFKYLSAENIGLWSRSQFGITAKCSYITNNLSELFNAWISEARHRPVLDLLDVVRQKIMVKMEGRRRMVARWKENLVPVVMKYVRDISL
ncbi:uncharacterized protein LOC120103904 [Phoenix dactylifera]|uniref:Uncharacterized protein LOC120103904 n=1 Tax=Phoenix dactylifera TaxID=42345 RepID=A0A8B9AMY3_PHODC|nr:uncharacterized protein LOC120103904 [Phoenix dactylifera]